MHTWTTAKTRKNYKKGKKVKEEERRRQKRNEYPTCDILHCQSLFAFLVRTPLPHTHFGRDDMQQQPVTRDSFPLPLWWQITLQFVCCCLALPIRSIGVCLLGVSLSILVHYLVFDSRLYLGPLIVQCFTKLLLRSIASRTPKILASCMHDKHARQSGARKRRRISSVLIGGTGARPITAMSQNDQKLHRVLSGWAHALMCISGICS